MWLSAISPNQIQNALTIAVKCEISSGLLFFFGTISTGSLPPAQHKNRKLNLWPDFNVLKQLLKGRAPVKVKSKQEKSKTWQKANLEDGAGRISSTENQLER